MKSGDIIKFRAEAQQGITYYLTDNGNSTTEHSPLSTEQISVILFLGLEISGLYRCLITTKKGEIVIGLLPAYRGRYDGNYLYIVLDGV